MAPPTFPLPADADLLHQMARVEKGWTDPKDHGITGSEYRLGGALLPLPTLLEGVGGHSRKPISKGLD
jgi:hypothetical protein